MGNSCKKSTTIIEEKVGYGQMTLEEKQAFVKDLVGPAKTKSIKIAKDLVFMPPYGHGNNLSVFTTNIDGEPHNVHYLLTPSSNNPQKNLMIYFHGNSEDVEQCIDLFRNLASRWNIDILGVEYTGYGKTLKHEAYGNHPSRVEPDEPLMHKDAYAGYKLAVTELGYDPERIVIFGRSLGSGAAGHLAYSLTQEFEQKNIYFTPFAGVIFDSGIASTIYSQSDKGGMMSILKVAPSRYDAMENYKKVGSILQPMLFGCTSSDTVVSAYNSHRMHEIRLKNDLPSTLFDLPGYNHNDFCIQDQWIDTVNEFLGKVLNFNNREKSPIDSFSDLYTSSS